MREQPEHSQRQALGEGDRETGLTTEFPWELEGKLEGFETVEGLSAGLRLTFSPLSPGGAFENLEPRH